ncbi:xylulokinase [Pseudoxanthomonas dokdonensis]|uniref:Xylulose kinase n=1 Tax=Pseudoxanthomonas dokdonensis TaxID=344882 RepID=A0A0R0CQG5_9GAMM|nr:xylulokinase [Pseudoxanthomonas dokdonensis]KRG68490.1 xylulokinase [Pseudoxanthomonas dokdonensis]
MTLVAGIDAGTQSVKVVVYDAQSCQLRATASAALELISGDDGSREQHPQAWMDAVEQCFARIDPQLRQGIAALAVSGQQHGLVALDADGNVLAPAKLWCDTSSSAECEEIMQALGGAQGCIEAAGNPILAGYTASKIRWTRKHRPQAYAALATILLPHDYLNFRLTGERFMEYGDASGTGWLDVRSRQWSAPLLKAIDPDRDLSQCLPPLVSNDSSFAILPAMADRLGLSHAVRIAVGGGDNMMAAIGTGAVVPGRLAMSLGTSGTLFAYADQPVVDEHGAWAAFCSSSGGWLPLICTMNCTVATETVASTLGFSSRDGDPMITSTTPGADGLTMLPFFNGERTPDLPEAKASLHGMDMRNMSPAHLYRAAMEGATFSLRFGYDAFVAAGMQFDRILLTGGGANSPAWRQMVADVFGLPVQVPQQTEGAAFGAALQALWSLQATAAGADSLVEVVNRHVHHDPAQAHLPDASRRTAYQQSYKRYLKHLHDTHGVGGDR